MSRAFVREDGPDTTPLPDLPVSPHPNYVTPRGLAALQARLAEKMHSLFSAIHQFKNPFPLSFLSRFLPCLNKCANYSYRRILKPPC